ncbi:MAG: enoyl-CoA hydratase/isomerase family protein, partial [Pseudomonadales bacterium]
MSLEVKDGIHVLTLTNHKGENTFTLDVMNEYLAALDVVEQFEGNTALIIRCDHEKTFSTGINLQWLMSETEQNQKAFIRAFETLLYRLALLNAPTVVCINGNAYAGGAILASAADFRVMRSDRGRFCLPEVNINMTFPPVLLDIINLLPNKQALKH